jgi:SAM-dependent methyltransferase
MAVAEQIRPMMAQASEAEMVQRVIASARKLGLLHGGREYKNRSRTLFNDLDFRGKNVLEIGCGKGLMCLWAKIHGAKHVVGLEPMTVGYYDSADTPNEFATMARESGLDNVAMVNETLQNYRTDMKFDIVLSLASINHIDEPSCIELQRSAAAYESYVNTFRQLRGMMSDNGTVFIADATNRSFLSDLRMKNPFNPDIEWFKHQAPETWAKLLSECGFVNPKISWMSEPIMTHLGIGTVPRAMSYVLSSAFRLQMQCAPMPKIAKRAS